MLEMINFVFPNLAFIESSSRLGSDSDSGDDSCLEKVIDLFFIVSSDRFVVSLNCRRSSKEQECGRSGYSDVCLMFSDETPQSHVVSPLL